MDNRFERVLPLAGTPISPRPVLAARCGIAISAPAPSPRAANTVRPTLISARSPGTRRNAWSRRFTTATAAKPTVGHCASPGAARTMVERA